MRPDFDRGIRPKIKIVIDPDPPTPDPPPKVCPLCGVERPHFEFYSDLSLFCHGCARAFGHGYNGLRLPWSASSVSARDHFVFDDAITAIRAIESEIENVKRSARIAL